MVATAAGALAFGPWLPSVAAPARLVSLAFAIGAFLTLLIALNTGPGSDDVRSQRGRAAASLVRDRRPAQ